MEPNEVLNGMIERKLIRTPIAELLGFEVIKFSEGKCEIELNATTKHHNPMGTLHGGVMCDIADAAMGLAFYSTLKENELFTTINLQINFLKQVIEDKITAIANCIQRGKTIGFLECELFNSQKMLIAKASCSCKVLRKT